ncbi:hypothetical protein HanIR_Chr05g0231161 [Helianthus annuus]|nr:hypothetical protein HanIR_Chr05g0231161 [Helianthus annuus]
MKGQVGDGKEVRFWLDPWLKDKPLKSCFPNLFRLEREKKCMVRDRIVRPVSNPEARWNWRSTPNNNDEMAEWAALCHLLRDFSLCSDKRDSWMWLGDELGEFSVGSLKKMMDYNPVYSSRFVWDWCRWVPLKCNLFAWRAEMGKIPTRMELRKRNIYVPATHARFVSRLMKRRITFSRRAVLSQGFG